MWVETNGIRKVVLVVGCRFRGCYGVVADQANCTVLSFNLEYSITCK